MHRQFKRLSLALGASVTGLALTLTWYYAGQPKHRAEDGRDAVARLTESTDEVQRRETTRVIWESLSLNDDLFTGEAIRTSAHASAKIRLNTGVIIHLDPDSLVVLDQNDHGLALEFLEGNLFVQGADAAGARGVTLKTGQGEVSLAQADVSLSKSALGDVDLQVYRGQAQLKRGDQTTALDQDRGATLSKTGVNERGDQLKLLSPRAGEVVLLNFGGGDRLPLSWGKLEPGYRVNVAVGPTRANLSPLPVSFPGELGSAQLTLKPGKWFVRLSAVKAGAPDLASLMIPFELAPRAAPALLEPSPDQPVLKTSPAQAVRFRWLNRHPFAQQLLEVATDERFTKITSRQKLGGAIDQHDLTLADGTYFWRVTGFPNATARGLASAGQRLRVTSSTALEVTTLERPVDHQRVSVTESHGRGVVFTWRAGATSPQTLTVRDARGEVVFHADTATGTARTTDLNAGVYRWSVGTAAPFELIIFETPRLAWTNQTELLEYAEAKPSLNLAWDAVPAAANYRYRVAAADADLKQSPWRTVPRAELHDAVPSDGSYQVEVEALAKDGSALAAAPVRTVQVRRRAPLAAPAWPAGVGQLTSDARGNVALEWNAVEGARGYVLSVTNGEGQVVRKTFGRGPAALNRLKPGQYQLKVHGVDEFDRAGVESSIKILDVPNASDIRAPKIRAMKVR